MHGEEKARLCWAQTAGCLRNEVFTCCELPAKQRLAHKHTLESPHKREKEVVAAHWPGWAKLGLDLAKSTVPNTSAYAVLGSRVKEPMACQLPVPGGNEKAILQATL